MFQKTCFCQTHRKYLHVKSHYLCFAGYGTSRSWIGDICLQFGVDFSLHALAWLGTFVRQQFPLVVHVNWHAWFCWLVLFIINASFFVGPFPPVAWDNSRPMEKKARIQTVVYANGNKCHCGSDASHPTVSVDWSGANSNEPQRLFLHPVAFSPSDMLKHTCNPVHSILKQAGHCNHWGQGLCPQVCSCVSRFFSSSRYELQSIV